MRTYAEAIETALTAAAKDFPNSVIADLMMYFPQDTVLKLITIFSGQRLRFPKIETIWSSYRNKTIKATLDIKNNRVARDQLALFFGISAEKVVRLYFYMKQREKKKPQVRTKTVVGTAKRIYMMEQGALLKEFKEVLLHKKQ